MKVAFVVPRYGLDIIGGAEYLTRQVAEHLKSYYDIEILTTCAKSYHTWKNEYRPGSELINGIIVRRFKTVRPRNLNKHRWIEEKVFYNNHDKNDEINWLISQGPFSEELIDYIKTNKHSYDCYILFSFRYFPIYFIIREVGHCSVVAPFAENDPALDLEITKELFEDVKGILYSTPEERELILSKTGLDESSKMWDIIGCGIEIPPPSIESFKRTKGHNYILYLGRIDGSKGCYQLFEYYLKAVEVLDDMPDLVMGGYDAIEIPKHNKITYLGFVSEEEKASLLKGSVFLVMPSPYESLSLVTLEAMASGIPVLVNGECDVLKGHCVRSNGGLWYDNYEEFVGCSKLLSSDDSLRSRLGVNGKLYVEENYSWDLVVDKYRRLLDRLEEISKTNI